MHPTGQGGGRENAWGTFCNFIPAIIFIKLFRKLANCPTVYRRTSICVKIRVYIPLRSGATVGTRPKSYRTRVLTVESCDKPNTSTSRKVLLLEIQDNLLNVLFNLILYFQSNFTTIFDWKNTRFEFFFFYSP